MYLFISALLTNNVFTNYQVLRSKNVSSECATHDGRACNSNKYALLNPHSTMSVNSHEPIWPKGMHDFNSKGLAKVFFPKILQNGILK